ncbi:fimbrial biogenesis outer membrane usher protein, partial [Hafnia paralvei]|nr:fimbrial biogenesis outer membrane usher protein [Hafnia paralvei]
MVTLSLPSIAYADLGSTDLPPPPTASVVNQEQQFRLELVINRFNTGKLIPVVERNGHFFVQSNTLISFGLPADKFTSVE